MDPSDQTRNDGYAMFPQLTKAVKSGQIKFEKDALVVFVGCNTGNDAGAKKKGLNSLAREFAFQTGVTTIGADGNTAPVFDSKGKETGELTADKGFYKFEKQSDGSIKKTFLGKTINPSDYFCQANEDRKGETKPAAQPATKPADK